MSQDSLDHDGPLAARQLRASARQFHCVPDSGLAGNGEWALGLIDALSVHLGSVHPTKGELRQHSREERDS